MNTIRDHVKANLIVREPPRDWTRRPMMKRRHRIHKMRHVPSTGFKSKIQKVDIRSSMPYRYNPSSTRQFANQVDTAINFRSHSHHVRRLRTIDHWKIYQVGITSKGSKIICMECPTLILSLIHISEPTRQAE